VLRTQAVEDLKKMMPILIEHLIEHLDYEELYVNHVPKKYFSPKITRQLVTNRDIHPTCKTCCCCRR
jgi:hypothetical protein